MRRPRSRRVGKGYLCALLAAGLASGPSLAQVVDHQIPLNYNHHAMAHAGEAAINPSPANADSIMYRSIADRGLYFDLADPHGFGSYPLIGVTGVTYGLFNSLGYANCTTPGAAGFALDAVHLGNRVLDNALEPNAIPTTNLGSPPPWTPSAQIASIAGDGTTVTVTTSAPHGFAVGNAVGIHAVSPAVYNGNFTVASVPNATTFTYASTATGATVGAILANNRVVTSMTGNGTAVTVVTATPHGLAVGTNNVYIQGADIGGYNGTYSVASVPNTTTFTYANATTGTPAGSVVPVAVVLDHSTSDQVTVLSSPIAIDAATEIGVLYMVSNGPGAQFDCVLTFNNGSTDTNVTVRLAAPDWFGSTGSAANPAIISGQPVTSQSKMTHTDGGITYTTFRGVDRNDAANLTTFSATNAGPNLNVTEAVISVPLIIAQGNNVAGQNLTKIAFRNATWGSQTVSAITNPTGTLATATVASTAGYVPGQPVVIAGANPAGLNGTYLINSVVSGTQFTYLNGTTAASSTGTRTAQRPGIGRGYSIYSVTARTGSPVNANCATPQVISAGDTSGTNSHAFGATPTSCGVNDTSAVWYAYTAQGNQLIEARTCGSTLDTTLAVYTSCGGSAIACNDNGCGLASRVQWTGSMGQTYLIRVAGKNGATGNFTLRVEDPAPIDITMPLQFNWNGINHGSHPSGSPSEQTIPSGTGAGQGSTHENRSDLNGYRSIADRGLLCDGSAGSLNFGGTIGYQGMLYEVYSTPLQADMIHLGRRDLVANMARVFSPPGTTWPAQGGTSTSNNGLAPLWLSNIDHTTPQTSSMAALNAVMGPDTKIGILYHSSDVPTNAPLQRYASIDVTLSFTDSSSVTTQIFATDWFHSNTQVLPGPAPLQGVEAQRVLGTFRAVQNTDRGDDTGTTPSGGWLKVLEAVISTQSLITSGFPDISGKTLASITFSNPTTYQNAAAMQAGTTNNFTSGMGIYAATLRNPASFNLNFGPSAVGTVTPNQLGASVVGRMTVNVSRGSGSPNNITSVIVDGTSIGLSSMLALNDSGTGGDQFPNDNVWSANVAFPINTAPGSFSLPFVVTDAQSRTASNNIIFSIVAPQGSLTPATRFPGDTVRAAITVGLPTGANTDITMVTVDGSPIGLGSIALNDSAMNGDQTAGDGVWSADFTIPGGATGGSFPLTFTVTDAALRSAQSQATLNVIAVTDIGTVGTGITTFNGTVDLGTVKWLRFTLASPIDAGSLNFLDIDTEGSALTPTNDTELGLYDALGNRIADDDDDGSGLLSQLTFGVANPARPAVGGLAYNGRDGAMLPAGTYMLAYPGFNATFNATNFDVTTASTYSGPVTINFRIGTVPAGGPPATFTDLGSIAVGPLNSPTVVTNTQALAAGGVQWFRFEIPAAITGANPARQFLDIDTEGSIVGDTTIGLFRDDGSGTLVLTDTDDGSGLWSQISYGRGTRPAPGDGVAYNGRDGLTLSAGIYYLAVAEHAATFGNNFIVFFQTGTTAANITVNIRSGVQSPILHGPVTYPTNNHEYYLLDIGFSFADAEAFAVNQLDGHLVSMGDVDENEWVRGNVLTFDGMNRRAWIGLWDPSLATVNGAQTWTWTDGTPFSFTNWSAGEPSLSGGNEHYVEMFGDNGLWNDLPLAGATAGNYALIEVAGCAGDFNGNGSVTVQDIFDFLAAYFSQLPSADVNNSGSITVQDIFDFLVAYFAGC